MTDRAALANKLEALPKGWRSTHAYGGTGHGFAMCAEALERLLPDILAALREPGLTPEQEAAIKRVDAAIFRAVETAAHQRGAEAMREAAAEYCNSFSIAAQAMGNAPLAASLRSTADMIRLAPLPEPKP